MRALFIILVFLFPSPIAAQDGRATIRRSPSSPGFSLPCSRRSDFVATQSGVRANVIAAFREAGIALPEPDVRHIITRDAGNPRQLPSDSPGESRSDGT